jgi:hypothetical protein
MGIVVVELVEEFHRCREGPVSLTDAWDAVYHIFLKGVVADEGEDLGEEFEDGGLVSENELGAQFFCKGQHKVGG